MERLQKIAEMKPLVVAEATRLKALLTDEEKSKLDLDLFNPSNPEKCVYGLITGDCGNNRAALLIQECCEKVYVPPSEEDKDGPSGIMGFGLNGSPKDVPKARME